MLAYLPSWESAGQSCCERSWKFDGLFCLAKSTQLRPEVLLARKNACRPGKCRRHIIFHLSVPTEKTGGQGIFDTSQLINIFLSLWLDYVNCQVNAGLRNIAGKLNQKLYGTSITSVPWKKSTKEFFEIKICFFFLSGIAFFVLSSLFKNTSFFKKYRVFWFKKLCF